MYLRALNGKPGVILNLSTSASTTTNECLSSYGPSKTTVNRLTDCIDLGELYSFHSPSPETHFIPSEHSHQGVRCIAFHPGAIPNTGMGERVTAHFKPYLVDTLSLAGGTAVYLSSSRASYLSGRFVFSGWDMEALEGLKESIVSEDLLKMKLMLGVGLSNPVGDMR